MKFLIKATLKTLLRYYESKIFSNYDPVLSRQIDCLIYLIEIEERDVKKFISSG